MSVTRRTRGFVFAACVAAGASVAALLGACATQESKDIAPDEPVRLSDGAVDGDVDGATDDDGDAGPCADCDFFPDTCEAGSLCLNGPFDPSTTGGAFDVRTQINVIRGRSATDVWAAGALGAVAHFDGTSWSRSDVGTQESMRSLWLRDTGEVAFLRLESLFSRGAPDVDAGDDAGVSDGGWTNEVPAIYPPDYDGTTTIFESSWGTPGAEWLWVATRHTAYPAFPPSGLWRLHVAADGTFEVAHGLAPDVFGAEMTAIYGLTPDDLWAVGPEGTVVHITGAQAETPTFELFNSRTWDALNGVWAASDADVWAVGAEGTIRHYTGGDGVLDIVADVPTSEDLNAIWGSSSSDIWAVGNAGVVLHYDGKSWSRANVAGLGARRPDLTTVWMPSPGHVWIGGHGVVLSLGGKP